MLVFILFPSPFVVESCPTPGDSRCINAPCCSRSGFRSHHVYSMSRSSHLVLGLPRLILPLIPPRIASFSIPRSRLAASPKYVLKGFLSHLEGSSASVGRPGNCQSPVLVVENVDVRQSILLDISLDGIHIYLNFGLPLGLTHTFYLEPCQALLWSSLRLTCPYQHSRFCIRCVAIGWTVAVSLISSFLLCSLRLTPCIHRNILISVLFISISSFFSLSSIQPHICHSRF